MIKKKQYELLLNLDFTGFGNWAFILPPLMYQI